MCVPIIIALSHHLSGINGLAPISVTKLGAKI